MRVFVTGATGYIGSAVALALRRAGHDVTALVRPASEARPLRDAGVVIASGDFDSLPQLTDSLSDYDCTVHIANARERTVEGDRAAVDAFTAHNRHVVYTSGVWVLGHTTRADEASAVNPLPIVAWRPSHEERILGAGGAVLRPGCVYGGRQSLLADWFAAVDQNRALSIVGDGSNRWAMVDIHDLTDCYVRAVDRRVSGVLHAVDDTHATLLECARALGENVQIETTPLDTARKQLGAFADALAVNQTISSSETRQKLGWSPRRTFTSSIAEQWQEWRSSRA